MRIVKEIFIYIIITTLYTMLILFIFGFMKVSPKVIDIQDITVDTVETKVEYATSGGNTLGTSGINDSFRAKVIKPATSRLVKNGVEYTLTGDFMTADSLNLLLNKLHVLNQTNCGINKCQSGIHFYNQGSYQDNVGGLTMRHDCSGLVSWVFRQYGVLDKTYSSYDFYDMDKTIFREISPLERQTGDIYVKKGHVGMYIAEAETPGFIYVLDGGSCTKFSLIVKGSLCLARTDGLTGAQWKWLRLR